MKNFQFDYGQPLAIVALLLVLSTTFAFFEEPATPVSSVIPVRVAEPPSPAKALPLSKTGTQAEATPGQKPEPAVR